YNMNRLAVVPADGGAPRILTQKLDRGVSWPVFSADRGSLLFLFADDRSEYPAKVAADGTGLERLIGSPVVVSSLSSAAGHTAVPAATDDVPPEVFAVDGGTLRKLTGHNAALLSE